MFFVVVMVKAFEIASSPSAPRNDGEVMAVTVSPSATWILYFFMCSSNLCVSSMPEMNW